MFSGFDQLVVEETHLEVRRSANIGPGKGAPVIGIVVTGNARFIAIVDSWSARHGELNGGRNLLPPLALGKIGRVEFFIIAVVGTGRQNPEQTCRIVTVEQVHHREVRGIGIVLADGLEARQELGRLQLATAVGEALGVECLRRKEADYSIA